jgi:tellurite resistance protein
MSENWRNEPATEQQKEKLRFFGCTWDEGITAGQATDALGECASQFPDREAAWSLQKRKWTKIPGTLPVEAIAELDETVAEKVSTQKSETPASQPSVRHEGFFCGASAGPTNDPTMQSWSWASKKSLKFRPTRGLRPYTQQSIHPLNEGSLKATVKHVETREATTEQYEMYCPACGGNIKVPQGTIGKNRICPHCRSDIFPVSIRNRALRRQKIESGNPQERQEFWEQTGHLPPPAAQDSKHQQANEDPTHPSRAYLGAANLLRLCVLIAAADGQIGEVELDVFRQVIENQLDLTPTDHQRLQVLEKQLVQDPSSAAKTLASVAKSVPPHNRFLIAKVLVRVAAADGVVTKDERRALEQICKAFELSPETLENLVFQACPPPQTEMLQTKAPAPIPYKPDVPKESEAELIRKKEWDEWLALQERLAERQKKFLPNANLSKNETAAIRPSARHEGFFCGSEPPKPGVQTNYDGAATQTQLSELRSYGIEAGPGLKLDEANELITSCRSQKKNARTVLTQETEPEPPIYLKYPPEPKRNAFKKSSLDQLRAVWTEELNDTTAKNRALYNNYLAEMERWNAQRSENGVKQPMPFPEPPKPQYINIGDVTSKESAAGANQPTVRNEDFLPGEGSEGPHDTAPELPKLSEQRFAMYCPRCGGIIEVAKATFGSVQIQLPTVWRH